MPRTALKNLLSQYELPPSFIYLAPIVPIVQVMWADGQNQLSERTKLAQLLDNHCRTLSEMAEGLELISKVDREIFNRVFIASRPEPGLLDEFSELAMRLVAHNDPSVPTKKDLSLNNPDQLTDACMEIAAACASEYPAPGNAVIQKRIVDEERKLIVKVVDLALNNTPA